MNTDRAGEADALGRWLTVRVPGARAVTVEGFNTPKSGYSAETLMVDTLVTTADDERAERFVLRRETADPAIYPAQAPGLDVEIAIQYRAMHSIASHSRVPIAPLIGFEDDATVLGAPFFVMGFIEGQVPIENPSYLREGFFHDASPADRRRLLERGLQVLAEVHRIDWRTAGLDWLNPEGTRPGTARQLEIWEHYARRELGDRRHPLLERGFDWLHRHLPEDDEITVAWGDPRPGNMIWRDFECVCVTDFEAVALAPPEYDLGWWLMFDRWSHENMGLDRLPGEPSREEQRAIYERALGRAVGDPHFYEVLAAARYCAIVVRVMNRTVARGQMPADNTYWLDNVSTQCLEALLDS
jgi:aminoglycoside phosphotransferase (APT) family kinase protein